MTHDDIIKALRHGAPGVEWDYSGDGSSLAPHEVNGDKCPGLVWRGTGDAPTYAQLETWLAEALATAEATATATAWVELRALRDRWLAQTDYLEVFVCSPAAMVHLPADVKTDITANAAAWTAWRQALRDLPGLTTDPVAMVDALGRVHATSDVMPAPLPAAPSAPVVHLT